MKRNISIILILFGLAAVLIFANRPKEPSKNQSASQPAQIQTQSEQKFDIAPPLDNAAERITKKPFGIHVSPGNSPVSPERFTGYHTAVDFEILPGEETADVKVFAICTGKILRKETARGYGGMVVQACTYHGSPITVVYGHIRLTSMSAEIGDTVNQGDQFVVLGTAYSAETGGERKHLHLGIHKGSSIDTRGYVSDSALLANWYDYREVVNK